MPKISVVVNTLNEENLLKTCLDSVKWADEIIVVDMLSDDESAKLAKSKGAKVFPRKREKFVELARNFGISKASGDWILIIDPDEEVGEALAKRLREISEKMREIDFIRIPRKNIIFGKWMKASKWWPDLNIRFFKKGKVSWSDKIHIPPQTSGAGLDLEGEEMSILHHHYESITQFLERLNRYTDAQAEELVKSGYKFSWQDLVVKPNGEFLSRFFANRGFEDGLHGLALSLLQAFSFLIMYLKTWEKGKFKEENLDIKDINELKTKVGIEINYWFKYANLSKNPFKRFAQKVKNKLA